MHGRVGVTARPDENPAVTNRSEPGGTGATGTDLKIRAAFLSMSFSSDHFSG